jgi:hypothetical protein
MSWEKFVPEEFSEESESLLFLSRMSYISVVQVLLNRRVIPEDILTKCSVDSFDFHVFNTDVKWGKQLHEMMAGIEDGITKKYVKEVQIVLGKSRDEPEDIVETFVHKFIYGKGKKAFQLKDNEGNSVAVAAFRGMKQFRGQVAQFIANVENATSVLAPLPDGVMPFIQVAFYEEVTPPTYKCPAFLRCKELYLYGGKDVTIPIGSLNAKHDAIFVQLQSDYAGAESSEGSGTPLDDRSPLLTVTDNEEEKIHSPEGSAQSVKANVVLPMRHQWTAMQMTAEIFGDQVEIMRNVTEEHHSLNGGLQTQHEDLVKDEPTDSMLPATNSSTSVAVESPKRRPLMPLPSQQKTTASKNFLPAKSRRSEPYASLLAVRRSVRLSSKCRRSVLKSPDNCQNAQK